MSHLGERVTTLVDGQLGAEACERAMIHLAGCRECRDAVELERLTKKRLAGLGEPQLSGDLMARLGLLAGPSGPLPPRSGHVPGSPRPQLTPAAGPLTGGVDPTPGLAPLWSDPSRPGVLARPPGRRGSSRPPLIKTPTVGRMVRVSRTSRNRMAAAMVGAVCLVGAGVAGGVANGGVAAQRVSPPVDSFVLEHGISTSTLTYGDQAVSWEAVRGGK